MRLAPQILAVELEQVERAMNGVGECAMTADQVEHSKSVLVANGLSNSGTISADI